MSDREPTAKNYRIRAFEMRALAQEIMDPKHKMPALQIADNYDILADALEARARAKSDVAPPPVVH